MSLQYIIDGYNITNNPLFKERIKKKTEDSRCALLELIKRERLTGSPNNKITVVFDGYPSLRDNPFSGRVEAGSGIVFSGRESADEKIKKMLQRCANPRQTLVVSDDKEIKFFAQAYGASTLSVGKFIGRREKAAANNETFAEPELTYSQRYKITEELRKIWLLS